jgi:N-terminal half of MaoC dehydratase
MAVDRFPIEEGGILAFARAIGDPNPVYADPAHPATRAVGGILAPPTYVQASAQFDPDYPLRPRAGEPWFGSGSTATGVERSGEGGGGTGLHAEQHFEYHRPLRAGDVLRSRTHAGRRWEKEGRSGLLQFAETITEFRDAAGALVVTARSVSVRTERPVAQDR